jgi:DNA-binding NarL/FixJ family response regulator
MRYPQVLIHDDDGGLARALTPLAETRKPRWVLRQPRRLDACARLVMRGHPSVLVVKAGRDVNREMALIDRVRAASPEVPVVVVAVAASPALTALAWHLGAAFVFTAEPAPEALVAVVEKLMQRAFESCRGRPRRADDGNGALEGPLADREVERDDE